MPLETGEKYFGLVNVSNTCYVNSVLQALYFCTAFRKCAIRHLNEDKEEDSGGDSLLTSLAELFAQIESQKRSVGCLTPRRFLARLRKANDIFCTSEHQDAHEFLQFLLNEIVENVKKKVQKQRERGGASTPSNNVGDDDEQPEEEPRTWVHDIFQGYLVNQMKCLCCENVTVRRETFLDLSVDIERHTSIAACLRAFESTELLRAGNKFFCDMCGCLQEAEKRLRIYQLPSILTLHLKRFKFVERLGRCCRLPYRVVFPLQLRVVEHRPPRRHSPGEAGSRGGHQDQAGRGRGINPAVERDGATGAPDGEESSTTASQPPSRLFELRSVIIHIGREISRGHYVTVVRTGDRCVLLDDDVVRVVEPEVFRSFYGTAGASSHFHNGGAHSSGTHERHQHLSGAGWGANESGNDQGGGHANTADRYPGHSPSVPLYERSPEGTCCGYLLLYEAVEGAPDHEAGLSIDFGAVADWISEDRNLTDSDSGESTGERAASVQDRPQLNACDDSELTQAFEQRCIPRGPATRQQYTSGLTVPAASAGLQPTANGESRAARDRSAPSGGSQAERLQLGGGSAGHPGAMAWAATDSEGGVRTLGSVVPAVGATDKLMRIEPSHAHI